MISDILKRSYDQTLTVKVTLKDTDIPLVGVVVGGSRSLGGESVDYISYDGFYSYTFKVISGYEFHPRDVLTSGYLTILVSEIEKVEIVE